MERQRRLGYEPGLDGLRAIAVAAVVGFHYWGFVFRGGWLGVNLFFVISGYLITRLLNEEFATTGTVSLRSFYQRRAARLLPVLFVAVPPALVIGAFVRRPSFVEDARGAITGLLYVANIDRYLGISTGGMFGHLWSLSLEEQFYVLWPLAFVVVVRKRGAHTVGLTALGASCVIFAATIIRALFWFDFAQLYNGPESQGMAFLLAGCALGLLGDTADVRLCTWLLAAAGLSVLGFTLEPSQRVTFIALPAVCLAMCAIVAGSVSGRLQRSILGHPLLVHIGQRSYGLYVIHYPVDALVHGALIDLYPKEARLSLLSLLATGALAEVSYRWVEQPLRRRLGGSRRALLLDLRNEAPATEQRAVV